MVNFQRLSHRLGLLVQFSQVNLKFTFITLIGLTIGFSMASAALFQLDSTRTDFYFTTLVEFQSELKIQAEADGAIEADTLNTISEMRDFLDSQIEEEELEKFYRLSDYYPYVSIRPIHYFTRTSNLRYHTLFGITNLNDSFLAECVAGSRLPNNLSEVLVFVENVTANPIFLNERFNISRDISDTKTYNFTLTVVGLITPATSKNNSILGTITGYRDFCSITSLNASINLIQTMKTEINEQYGYIEHFSIDVDYQYTFDFTTATRTTILAINNRIVSLRNRLRQTDNYGTEFILDIDIPLGVIYLKLTQFENLYLAYMFLSLPVFIVVAFLVSFSLGLINERRSQTLKLLKMRGVSNRFVFLIMGLETLVIAACVAVLALLVGVPLSLFLGSSTGVLTFDRSIDPSKLVLTEHSLQSIFIMSGLFTSLLHLPSLVRLSRSTIVSLSEQSEKTGKRRIRVIFSKVDIFFLLLGSIGIVVFAYIVTLLKDNQGTQEIFTLLLPFFYFLVLFSPLLFLIGFISAFNRFMPKTIRYLGDFWWHRNWRLAAIAARNLAVNPDITTRTTLLLAITFAFLVIFSILPVSYHYQKVDNVFYAVGGDVSFSFYNHEETDYNTIVPQVRNVPGFTFTMIKEWVITDYGANGYPVDTKILGIEDDFGHIAHWQRYYADEPLETLVKTLFSSAANNSAIVDSKTIAREQLSIGNQYTIEGEYKSIVVAVQGVTHYWPRMNERDMTSFFITKASYIVNISVIHDITYKNTVIGKILPGYDKSQVMSSLKQIVNNRAGYNYFLQIAEEFDVLQEDNIITNFQWFVVNANLLAGLVIIFSAIVLFAITRVFRHSREIALSRSLGMKFPQVFSVMFMEPFLLFILSGVAGGLVGGILTLGIVTMTEQLALPGAPFIFQINILLIFSFYLLLFLVTLGVGLVTSLGASRTTISKILKVE